MPPKDILSDIPNLLCASSCAHENLWVVCLLTSGTGICCFVQSSVFGDVSFHDQDLQAHYSSIFKLHCKNLGGGFKYSYVFFMFTPILGVSWSYLTVRIFFKWIGSTTNQSRHQEILHVPHLNGGDFRPVADLCPRNFRRYPQVGF